MKLRLTALSISSIDMKSVMMLRRNKNPATPSTNNTALRMRYQDKGTPVMSIHFLSRQHDGADDCDQDQYRGHFEGQQVSREERLADVLRRTAREAAEVDRPRVR